jgi:hypothetical protein
MIMANAKKETRTKDTPTKMAKRALRYAHQLINQRTDAVIGPRYVFTALRVPQVKLY